MDNNYDDAPTATAAEARRMLRKPKPVFAFVRLTTGDGTYIPVTKTAVLQSMEGDDPDASYRMEEHEDGIYID